MGEKIVVGPNRGLRTDRTAFNIDNDSFPTLTNAYQWRGRVKRKRGTSPLCRLERYFSSGATTILLDASGNGNLITGFSLQQYANIVPGTVTITDSGAVVYTDPSMDGTLSPSGSINYASGEVTIAASSGLTITAVFFYYPDLPVMGLEDYLSSSSIFPGTVAFDTTYSYNINTAQPYSSYDVSYYNNPATGTYAGYTQKSTWTPLTWNGQNYQQFWSVNYEGALWVTNGITAPFTTTNIGMQYKPIVTVDNITGGPPAIADLTITGHGLVVGDFVFVNEVATTTGINFQTGYVTAVVNANKVTVEFPNATIATNGAGGIAQYLTNRSDATKDCIRWYNGAPSDGSSPPNFTTGQGWVNFCPPLSSASFNIQDLPAAQYYLVGAVAIIPYKDRLLFIGPVVQTSSANSQVYLQDTVIYSQNGTPYYTCSFTGSASSPSTVFYQILVPSNQTATASSWFEDIIGFGGYISSGFSSPILSASTNEDVVILGFGNRQARLVATGNDVVPFNFFVINSELGTSSTFSTVTLDRGVLSVGANGIVITSQVSTERIDLDIPDSVFEFNLTNFGPQRVTSKRDYVNEWVYFTYLSNTWTSGFPNQTLLYNYRDQSWGLFNECYTTYGNFRKQTGYTWATIGTLYPTWSDWNDPWNAGSSTLLQQQVIGGNQQGFVVVRDDTSTAEAPSLEITNISFPSMITGATQANPCVLTSVNTFVVGQQITISNVVGMTQLNGNTYTITAVTPTTITINVNSSGFTAYTSGGTATPTRTIFSPNHCLNNGDYITISGCLGTIDSQVNGKVFSVALPDSAGNAFNLNPPITTGTYLGGGVITRFYVPLIQTKQFPVAWGNARKVRLGPQQYLFTTTPNGQIELQIYLSQNSANPYNSPIVVPDPNSPNNALIYTDTLYTCPEGTNLGLTPANINLNLISANLQQAQTWHRMNTSLIGDTVQIGFTLSDTQMRDPNLQLQEAEVELHAFILDVNPSQLLT